MPRIIVKYYQIKITLAGSKPPIWRRVVVPCNMLLPDFHQVIQTVMGWGNTHLHEFNVDGMSLCEPSDDLDWDNGRNVDYSKIKLFQVLQVPGAKMSYVYDFGDDWQHIILLEKMLDESECEGEAVCITGRRATPPEDCGGIWAYMNLLDIKTRPGSKEYKEWSEWMNLDFDPKAFDIENVNGRLRGYFKPTKKKSRR